MKSRTLVLALVAITAAAALSGCVSMTRTETEAYTVVHRDTTFTDAVRNAPGERDNGVIYPTSRETAVHREELFLDSVHERYYPDFLRAGVLELAAFGGTGTGAGNYWGGLFGAYGLLADDAGVPHHDHLFTGGLIRLFPYEHQLRWFRDAANWTWGTYGAEAFIPQTDINKVLVGVLPIYIRKRYFLREQAPYIMVVPTIGVGLLPCQYVNIGATLDVGSWGGLNFRAYAGFAGGIRLPMFGDSLTRTSSFPYYGLGVSVLDFVNTVDETQHEWKEYRHHAVEINALDVDVIHSLVGTKTLFDTTSSFLTGIRLRFATMEYPLWNVDKHVFVGTTLFNIIALGRKVGGMSVLPLRAGYHMVVAQDELTDQVSAEYNYFPSSFLHLSNKLSLMVAPFSINATIGYMTGNAGSVATNSYEVNEQSFSGSYIALGLGVSDHIFNLDKMWPW